MTQTKGFPTILVRLFLLVIACALASCGGGGAGGGSTPPPETVTFAFRVQGTGAEQEFRYATSSEPFIARARSQLMLPVVGRQQFPIGPIAAGSNGVNLNWNWHFTELAFTDAAIELCDGTPALLEAYVYAEVTGTYPLKKMAVGEVREIAQEDMRVEFNDVSDSRCPAAAVCVIAGWAAVDLIVRVGSRDPQRLTVTRDAGDRDKQALFAGYQFTLDNLVPYPVSGPAPKQQYRADLTVRKL
jgi:hypothetical protein